MMPLMRRLLALMGGLTLAAAAFLALSYVTLKGVDDLEPVWRLALLVAPGGLTLGALAWPRPSRAVQVAAVAAGAGLIWVGWSAIDRTLAGPHFEGYALVLGAMAIAQGVLAAVVFGVAVFRGRRVFRI